MRSLSEVNCFVRISCKQTTFSIWWLLNHYITVYSKQLIIIDCKWTWLTHWTLNMKSIQYVCKWWVVTTTIESWGLNAMLGLGCHLSYALDKLLHIFFICTYELINDSKASMQFVKKVNKWLAKIFCMQSKRGQTWIFVWFFTHHYANDWFHFVDYM